MRSSPDPAKHPAHPAVMASAERAPPALRRLDRRQTPVTISRMAKKKISDAQRRARKEASARLKALNKERRSAATEIARSATRAAKKKAAAINRRTKVITRHSVAGRHDRAEDAIFF